MKKAIILNVFLSVFISTFSGAITLSSADTFGILTIDTMTQGQLLWLNGRVGEANYIFTRQDEKICTVQVPVAVGSIAESDFGIRKTKVN